jgi:hypothetical protein
MGADTFDCPVGSAGKTKTAAAKGLEKPVTSLAKKPPAGSKF